MVNDELPDSRFHLVVSCLDHDHTHTHGPACYHNTNARPHAPSSLKWLRRYCGPCGASSSHAGEEMRAQDGGVRALWCFHCPRAGPTCCYPPTLTHPAHMPQHRLATHGPWPVDQHLTAVLQRTSVPRAVLDSGDSSPTECRRSAAAASRLFAGSSAAALGCSSRPLPVRPAL